MEQEKDVFINGKKYVLVLTKQCELMFYTFDNKRDRMATFGSDTTTTANLHGKINAFTLFRQIEKFVRTLFKQGVGYFYFTCERERFEIYNFFINRMIKNSNYSTVIDKEKNTFYVYKSCNT